MGMFTTVHGPHGMRFQIKTGFDDLEEYSVGDAVNWQTFPDRPGEGKLLDGVYWGTNTCFPGEGADRWVIIKDHQIQTTLPISEPYKVLVRQYGIRPPPRSWWSARSWERHDRAERRHRLEKRSTWRWLSRLDPQERAVALMVRLVRHQMRQKSFLRRLIEVAK